MGHITCIMRHGCCKLLMVRELRKGGNARGTRKGAEGGKSGTEWRNAGMSAVLWRAGVAAGVRCWGYPLAVPVLWA